MIGIIMFFVTLVMLLVGFPVAFTFGGMAILFGLIAKGPELFAFMPFRIWNVMNNIVLIAIPLFVFMGLILQRSKIAENLLVSMGRLFGSVRGGLAISTVIVGVLLAASTGIVGASVIAMGVISLPVMMKYKFKHELATGTICAAGTLGQIIPPSIILILLGDVLGQPIGDMFTSAIIPGLVLVVCYIAYIAVLSFLKPDVAPAIQNNNDLEEQHVFIQALINVTPPLLLIVLVLGSIFGGVATPTESSALGVIGAILLALFKGRLNIAMIKESARESIKITSMVFAILIGATAFSMVLTYTGGDALMEELILSLPGEKWGFIIFSMLIIFVLGFFIDFVEISLIIVPLLLPVAEALNINLLWFGILLAMNLQTSFLTPPFGFSLFYLRGVAPASIDTIAIYKGVIPFIIIQVLVLATIVIFPEFYGMNKS